MRKRQKRYYMVNSNCFGGITDGRMRSKGKGAGRNPR